MTPNQTNVLPNHTATELAIEDLVERFVVNAEHTDLHGFGLDGVPVGQIDRQGSSTWLHFGACGGPSMQRDLMTNYLNQLQQLTDKNVVKISKKL